MTKTFVGIDIASEKMDIFISSTGEYLSLARSQNGVEELKKSLLGLDVKLITMEATGGFETFIACQLNSMGYDVAVVNPLKVRNFAKALGRFAKTDKIDCRVLCDFGEKINPAKTSLISEEQIHLKQLVRRRKSLLMMERMEKNHLSTETDISVQESIHEVLDVIEDSLKRIEAEIDELILSKENLSKAAEIMESVPGVGKVVSQTLLAELPEIGATDRGKIVALAGLAPFNCDSGLLKGKRRIWGGRSKVREALYMSAMVAIRHNEKLKEYYLKLRERGKPMKVAIVACMRKLLLILNSMIQNQSFWQEF